MASPSTVLPLPGVEYIYRDPAPSPEYFPSTPLLPSIQQIFSMSVSPYPILNPIITDINPTIAQKLIVPGYYLASSDMEQFRCQECGAIFRKSKAYEQHRYIHLPYDQRPYACPFRGCKSRFTRKQDLNGHITKLH